MRLEKIYRNGKRLVPFMCVALAGWFAFGKDVPVSSKPAKVEVRQSGGKWRLFVNNKEFFIKGAGLEQGDYEKLAEAGGNSFRTWRTTDGPYTGQQILDRAQKDGLYVAMGLDLATERHGFDYSDTNAVARQFDEMKAQVLQFKDHPALLLWDIGNELNLDTHNPKVWDAVNDISKMIHQLDPNHPTTTSLSGISKELVEQIKSRAPDLDLVSVQSYADIVNLPGELQRSGWDGAYAVTEWGATGHWECGKTAWGAPIEDNSTVKAELFLKRYEAAIASDQKNCLGSYVFLWGQKQERTPTWYGMFLATGEGTESVDVMQYLWTGTWPEVRSPQLSGFWLAEKTADQNIHLTAGQDYKAKVAATSSGGNALTYSWEVLEESSAKSAGGDLESQPTELRGLVDGGAGPNVRVKAPVKPGPYRLYVYVHDSHKKAAYANIPFYVDEKAPTVGSINPVR